ncbi:uncharacterized protein LOC122848043 [Aphidius gifuensis]|uniref:uncharacterized protein LOC122848043 n=1 Tax=Aphidius gifuensis TaxID=684658 RepID=UPI001CDD12C6|nr:uncharacterized protein LOC122848043 [Aphidius gifuensis]
MNNIVRMAQKKLKPNAVPTLFGDVLIDYLSKIHQNKSNYMIPLLDVIIDEYTTDNKNSLFKLPKSNNTKSLPSDEQQIELPLVNLDEDHLVSIFTHNIYPDTFNSFLSILADELQAEIMKKYNKGVIKFNFMLQNQHRLYHHEI